MDSIDLRSDTVSWPTSEMRTAMAQAPVGDDVFGDDPTVNRLEALVAERLDKESALFVSSGTQGNLIALLTHCGRGDEYICGKQSHTFYDEVGGTAALGGIHTYPIEVQADGTLPLESLQEAIRDVDDIHFPATRLISIENTQGIMGSVPIPLSYIQSVRELCNMHGLAFHMDGARIWNAATALKIDIADLVTPVDSITFCLSKGLCAPAGSVLAGSKPFINRARRIRKMLGGGMRQAGILASAGIIALEQMTGRLDEDHANALRLGEGLSQIDGIRLKIPSSY